MNEIIGKEIELLKKDIPKLSTFTDEYLFPFVCYKYFYNEGNLDFKDHKKIFTDGKADGGIDLISTKEDSNDQAFLLLMQSKYVSSLQNSQDIVDIFTKMDQTVRNFEDNQTGRYSDRLKRIFKENLAFVEDLSPTINLILFISVDIEEKRKEEIEFNIANIAELSRYEISIYYKHDIEHKIESVKAPKKFVPESNIVWAKDHGMIKYGDSGLLVDVSANSLRDLYDRYKDEGLFEQNFRYFIRNKKIDDAIKQSLLKKRNEFWFLNNGIIIGCSDFRPDGNKIKLYNFSVINGCQTTTLIGEYQGKNQGEDFYLPCKIVKSSKSEIDDTFYSFIATIAESSNSQKPISDRDLKSNRIELRNLKDMLAREEPRVFLIIKRGESVKKKNIDNWQRVQNDYLGQLILSFNLQQPGTARSSKKKIFADENIYSKVFKRTHDVATIKDILKLDALYTEFLNESKEPFILPNQESVANNGQLVIMAVIGFLLKHKRGLLNMSLISDSEEWEKELQRDNLKGRLFSDYSGDDFQPLLYGLFIDIIQELALAFQPREKEKKTVSNFLKLDSEYRTHIIQNIYARFIQNPRRQKELTEYLKIFC